MKLIFDYSDDDNDTEIATLRDETTGKTISRLTLTVNSLDGKTKIWLTREFRGQGEKDTVEFHGTENDLRNKSIPELQEILGLPKIS